MVEALGSANSYHMLKSFGALVTIFSFMEPLEVLKL